MASVKETVKETLVGSKEAPELSHQARSIFVRHAQKDENGDLFMTEDEFINAVAPKQEDYVSIILDLFQSLRLPRVLVPSHGTPNKSGSRRDQPG
jgi:solute carrier family 25 aspartate/glutamate transporter 12/13